MATQPTDDIVRVAENDTTLPSTGLANKLEPPTQVLTVGYDLNELVPAEDLNYIFDNIGKWLEFFKQVSEGQITAGDGLESDANDIGTGQTLSVGTPSTLNGNTNNATTSSSHTHELSDATTTLKGVAELGTQTEVNTGTDNTKIVTPATLEGKLTSIERGMALIPSSTTSCAFDITSVTESTSKAALHVIMQATTNYYPATVPLRFLFSETTSGTLMVDNTDGTDIRFTYSYSAPTLTLTAVDGDFVAVYVEGKGS